MNAKKMLVGLTAISIVALGLASCGAKSDSKPEVKSAGQAEAAAEDAPQELTAEENARFRRALKDAGEKMETEFKKSREEAEDSAQPPTVGGRTATPEDEAEKNAQREALRKQREAERKQREAEIKAEYTEKFSERDEAIDRGLGEDPNAGEKAEIKKQESDFRKRLNSQLKK